MPLREAVVEAAKRQRDAARAAANRAPTFRLTDGPQRRVLLGNPETMEITLYVGPNLAGAHYAEHLASIKETSHYQEQKSAIIALEQQISETKTQIDKLERKLRQLESQSAKDRTALAVWTRNTLVERHGPIETHITSYHRLVSADEYQRLREMPIGAAIAELQDVNQWSGRVSCGHQGTMQFHIPLHDEFWTNGAIECIGALDGDEAD